jgi:MFS family permease
VRPDGRQRADPAVSLLTGAAVTTADAHEGPSPSGRWDRATIALLVGYFASSAGLAALVTALGKQVYDLSGRELDLGLLGLAEFAPAALLVLVTGTLADRLDRRRIAAVAVLGEGLAAVMMVGYLAGSPTAVGPLFGFALVLGTARAFVAPAARSLPADIVAPDRLPWLVARWSITLQVALISGPVLAGSLYAADPVAPFAATVVLFAVAAVGFLLIPSAAVAHPPAPPAVTETTGARARLHEALEGLRFVRRQPILLGAISLDLFAVLFGGAVALLPAIAEERLGVGAIGFGWLRAATGIGAAAVMLALAVRPIRRHVGATLLIAVATFGLGTIVLGSTRNYAVAFVAVLVLAGADALSVFIRVTLVPLVTPRVARGRVLAVENVFIGASNELGAFESGVTAQVLGPALAVGLGGVATLVVAATWWRLFPALRKVDSFPRGQDS